MLNSSKIIFVGSIFTITESSLLSKPSLDARFHSKRIICTVSLQRNRVRVAPDEMTEITILVQQMLVLILMLVTLPIATSTEPQVDNAVVNDNGGRCSDVNTTYSLNCTTTMNSFVVRELRTKIYSCDAK